MEEHVATNQPYYMVVVGVTGGRRDEFKSLLGSWAAGLNNQSRDLASTSSSASSELLQSLSSRLRRPTPLRCKPLGKTVYGLEYSCYDDFCPALKLFTSRGFLAIPLSHDPCGSGSWHMVTLLNLPENTAYPYASSEKSDQSPTSVVYNLLPEKLREFAFIVPSTSKSSIQASPDGKEQHLLAFYIFEPSIPDSAAPSTGVYPAGSVEFHNTPTLDTWVDNLKEVLSCTKLGIESINSNQKDVHSFLFADPHEIKDVMIKTMVERECIKEQLKQSLDITKNHFNALSTKQDFEHNQPPLIKRPVVTKSILKQQTKDKRFVLQTLLGLRPTQENSRAQRPINPDSVSVCNNSLSTTLPVLVGLDPNNHRFSDNRFVQNKHSLSSSFPQFVNQWPSNIRGTVAPTVQWKRGIDNLSQSLGHRRRSSPQQHDGSSFAATQFKHDDFNDTDNILSALAGILASPEALHHFTASSTSNNKPIGSVSFHDNSAYTPKNHSTTFGRSPHDLGAQLLEKLQAQHMEPSYPGVSYDFPETLSNNSIFNNGNVFPFYNAELNAQQKQLQQQQQLQIDALLTGSSSQWQQPLRRASMVDPISLALYQNPAAVSARIVDLVRESATKEILLSDLAHLYLARHGVPLTPTAYGFTSLKSFILAVPELSLVWIYSGAPNNDLCRLRSALNLPQWNSADFSSAYSSAAPQPPVSLSAVYVTERQPSIGNIGRDVIIALVAHWILLHEMFGNFGNREITGMEYPPLRSMTSLAKGGTSCVGMPVSLLARTWEVNWSHICTVPSLLARSGASDLESFVRTISCFFIREHAVSPPPDGISACYQESNTVIYLRRAARVPLIPELVPDPTTAAYAVPSKNSSGAFVIFFPPLPSPFGSLTKYDDGSRIFSSNKDDLADGSHKLERHSVSGAQNRKHDSGRPVSASSELRKMLFELITAACEWQRLRWNAGEDLLEMHEEQLEKILEQQTVEEKKNLLPEPHRAETETIENGNAFTIGENNLEDEKGGNDVIPESPKRSDNKRNKKKEKKEARRHRKSGLFAMSQSSGLLSANLTENNESSKQEGNSQATQKTTLLGKTEESSNTAKLISRLIEQAERSPELQEKRRIFRAKNIGTFVSSIKVEWSRYYDSAFPLTYFMERLGTKKLKTLLTEIPNLILTGDGGFIRVATAEHAKLLDGEFPPKGYSSDGCHVVSSVITPTSDDPQYSCKTYLSVVSSAELAKFKARTALYRRLSAANNIAQKRLPFVASPVETMGRRRQTMHRTSSRDSGPNISSVWEMLPDQVTETIKKMLIELVRLHCTRQLESKDTISKTSKETDNLLNSKEISSHSELRETDVLGPELEGISKIELDRPKVDSIVLDSLTESQKKVVSELKELGILGLKLHDVPSKWNHSFVLFSPFSSFLKKTGIDSMKDAQFIGILDSIKKDVFLGTSTDGLEVLFPTSTNFLNTPHYHRPPNISCSTWMKRKSLAYVPQGTTILNHVNFAQDSTDYNPLLSSYSTGDKSAIKHFSPNINQSNHPESSGRRSSSPSVVGVQNEYPSPFSPMSQSGPVLYHLPLSKRTAIFDTLGEAGTPPPPPPPPPTPFVSWTSPKHDPYTTVIERDYDDSDDRLSAVTRSLREIEANLSNQTLAMTQIAQILSMASKQTKQLPPECLTDVAKLLTLVNIGNELPHSSADNDNPHTK